MAINTVALRNLSVWVVDLPGEEPVGVMLATPIPVPVSQGGTGKVYLNPNAVLTGDGANPISDEPTFKYDGAVVMVGVPTKVAFDGGDGTATFGTDTPYADGVTIKPNEVISQQGYVSADISTGSNVSAVALAAESQVGGATVGKIHLQAARQGTTDSYIAINNDAATVSAILNPDTTSATLRGMDLVMKDSAGAGTASIAAATGAGTFKRVAAEEVLLLTGALVTVADGVNRNVATATPIVRFSGPTADWSITGITNGLGLPTDSYVTLINVSGFNMTVAHNITSSAGNRFYLHTGANIVVPDGQAITVYYRATGVGNRWTDISDVAAASSAGVTSLNALTGALSIAAGTAGTDFAVSPSGATVTLNLPDAGASARGVVTTGAQTFAGVKTFNGFVKTAGGLVMTQGALSLSNGANADVTLAAGPFQDITGPTADFSVSGLVSSYLGEFVILGNDTGYVLTLNNNSGLSLPRHRIKTPNAADLAVPDGGYVMLVHKNHVGSEFWHVTGANLSEMVSVTFYDSITPTGTVDSTTGSDGNGTFVLPASPSPAASLELFLGVNGGGSCLKQGVHYTLSGATITVSAPYKPIAATSESLLAWFRT